MYNYELKAMWSVLKIKINSPAWKEVEEIFTYIENFENKYSRFIKWNYLDNLNKAWWWEVDNVTKEFINLSLKVSELSEWYFDITVSPILEDLWYWEKWGNFNIGYKNINLEWNKLTLNKVKIELGCLWKWYIVDYVFNKLWNKCEKLLVDFGWDIKFKWDFEIWLESPFKEWEIIWEYKWKDISLASSSWLKRKFNGNHHLISPKDKRSIENISWVYISHSSSMISDIFSTAIAVSPLSVWIKILQNVKGLEGMIITKDHIYRSEWYKGKLNKK